MMKMYLFFSLLSILTLGINRQLFIELALLMIFYLSNKCLLHYTSEVAWWTVLTLAIASLSSKVYLHYRPRAPEDKRLRSDVLRSLNGYCSYALCILGLLCFFLPCYIPSESMQPTLYAGDCILARRFYKIKLPFIPYEFLKASPPQRGEVICFYFPRDPKISYIKRVIGLPGDTICFRSGRLHILPAGSQTEIPIYYSELGADPATLPSLNTLLIENLGSFTHLIESSKSGSDLFSDNTWVVPEGHYFVLGDNRGNSSDSRVWGFVPEKYLIGKASCILWSFDGNGYIPSLRWRRCVKRIV